MKGDLTMRMLSMMLGVLAMGTASAAPSLANVATAVRQDGALVTVTYDLADEDAIVTVEMFTNEVAVVARHVIGDVNRKVSVGTGRRFTWRPPLDGVPDAAARSVTVCVKAWTESAPPDYASLVLAPGQVKRYYASTNALPHPVTGAYYRTEAILFRRIPAGGVTFRMGTAGNAANEIQHNVSFAKDYYLSVFPVTQGQWRRGIRADKVSAAYGGAASTSLQHGDDPARELHPVDNCSSWYVSGVYNGQAASNLYERDSNTWIWNLALFTGEDYLRLPTDAEWEFACRAGTAEEAYSAGVRGDIAWYADNAGAATHPVGLKAPNAWGLYDMLGNVWEFCLDNYSANLGTADVTDPYVKGSACHKVYRGGAYDSAASDCRSARRRELCGYDWGVASRRANAGFRLYMRVP